MIEKKLKTKDVLDKEALAILKKELLKRKKQILKDLEDISGGNGKTVAGKVKFPEFGDKTDENAQEVGEYSTN